MTNFTEDSVEYVTPAEKIHNAIGGFVGMDRIDTLGDPQPLIDTVAEALADARNAVLEEAAKICDERGLVCIKNAGARHESGHTAAATTWYHSSLGAQSCAAAIRAEKDWTIAK